MKYIIYCGPGIGDFILILPMAREIKREDKNAYIMVIMTSDSKKIQINRTLLKVQNYIDEIDYYSIREPLQCLKFIKNIGRKKYDLGFVLQYTDNKATSKWPCKIIRMAAKKTCGIKLNNMHVKYDFEISRENGIRIADYPKMMLQKMEIAKCRNYGEIQGVINRENLIKEAGEVQLELSGRKVISLVVGTAPVSGLLDKKRVSNLTKNWEYKSWIELGKKLAGVGYDVLLLGGKKEEEELKRSILLTEEDNIKNLTGRYNIVQSIVVLMMSDIVVGADTGLMHCAGALDVPTLSLFGCTDYQEYLPMGSKAYYITSEQKCSPCFGTERALICKDITCMKNIQVNNVYKKIEEILQCNSGAKNENKSY